MKELSITYLLQLALRRWIILLAAMLACAAAAFGYCRFIATPSYSASTSLMVTNGGMLFGTGQENNTSGSVNNEFAISINMMDTYVNYLRTAEPYMDLANRWETEFPEARHYSGAQLRRMAHIGVREDRTFFLDITFSATNSQDAVRLAKRFAELAKEYLQDTFSNTELIQTDVLNDYTSVAVKTSPRTRLITMASALIGLILAYICIIFIDLSDHAITGEEGYMARFDIPLLGVVPYFDSDVAVNSRYSNSKGGYYYSEYGKN